jgi:hypothetical protein
MVDSSHGCDILKPHDTLSTILASYQQTVQHLLEQDDFPGVSSADLEAFKGQFRFSAFTCRLRFCPRATIGFESKQLRDEHEVGHTRKLPCLFPECKYPPFVSATALKNHTNKHHAIKPPWRPIRRVGHLSQAQPARNRQNADGQAMANKQTTSPLKPSTPKSMLSWSLNDPGYVKDDPQYGENSRDWSIHNWGAEFGAPPNPTEQLKRGGLHRLQDQQSQDRHSEASQPETPQPETPQPETPQPETPQPETPQPKYQSLENQLEQQQLQFQYQQSEAWRLQDQVQDQHLQLRMLQDELPVWMLLSPEPQSGQPHPRELEPLLQNQQWHVLKLQKDLNAWHSRAQISHADHLQAVQKLQPHQPQAVQQLATRALTLQLQDQDLQAQQNYALNLRANFDTYQDTSKCALAYTHLFLFAHKKLIAHSSSV